MPSTAGRRQAQALYPTLGPCTECGAQATDRHRVDGDDSNNAPQNVAFLCAPCHYLAHRERVCANGHPRTPENTVTDRSGRWRGCRECRGNRAGRVTSSRELLRRLTW